MMYTCDDTRAALTRGERPVGPEAEAHLAACAACRELVAHEAALGRRLAELEVTLEPTSSASEASLPDGWAALQAKLEREQAPTGWLRNLSSRARVAIAFGAAAVLAVAYFGVHRRPDLGEYPWLRWTGEAAAFVAVLWLAIGHALRPLHLPVREGARAAATAAAFALPVLLAALGPAHLDHAASLEGSGADFWPRALACLVFGIGMAVPLLAVLQLGDRLPGRRFGIAVLAAATGGLAGNLVLHTHCAITDPMHLLVGHASIGLVLVPALLLVAWLRGRRV